MVFAQSGKLSLHAFLKLALEKVRDVGTERLEWSSKKSRTCAVSGKRASLHQVDESRRVVPSGTEELFGHAA